jgi:plastocyanin
VQRSARPRVRYRYPGAMLRLRYLLVAAVAVAGLVAGSTQAASHTTKVKKLYAQDGPGFKITLKRANFVPVRRLKPGVYTFVVFDRSTVHNFHLKGPGVDKKTPIPYLGTKTWAKLRLKKGTYKFWCDPHKPQMHGSFTVA